MTQKNDPTVPAHHEHLEPRRLLAGDFTTALASGTLSIVGDAQDNSVFVTLHETSPSTRLVTTGGTTSLRLTSVLEDDASLRLNSLNGTDMTPAPGFSVGFEQTTDSTFTYDFAAGRDDDLGGVISHTGSITFDILDAPGAGGSPTGDQVTIGEFDVGFDAARAGTDTGNGITSGYFVRDTLDTGLVLFDMVVPSNVFDDNTSFTVDGPNPNGGVDLLVSPEFAAFLTAQSLATTDLTGAVAADGRIDADSTPVTDDLYRVRAPSFSDPESTIDGKFEVLYPRTGINSVSIGLNDGDDLALVGSAKVASFLLIDGGAGSDQAQVANSTVNGALDIQDASGGVLGQSFNNRLGAVIFNGGDGDDVLDLTRTTVTGALRVEFGAGDDLLFADDTLTASRKVRTVSFINGGDGDDDIIANDSKFRGAVANDVETIVDTRSDG